MEIKCSGPKRPDSLSIQQMLVGAGDGVLRWCFEMVFAMFSRTYWDGNHPTFCLIRGLFLQFWAAILCYNQGLPKCRALTYVGFLCVGEWLSLVEHLVRDQGVGGSNPLSPTILFKHLHPARLSHLVFTHVL